jgi:uncharacterized protein (DUF433 family)
MERVKQDWVMILPPKRDAIEISKQLAGELRQPLQPLSIWGQQKEEPFSISQFEMSTFALEHEYWLEECSRQAISALRDYVERSPHKLGGVPIFRDSRFSLHQFLVELADSDAIAEIADNFEIKEIALRGEWHLKLS